MEEKLNHIMEHYSEALDELMGAQEYAEKACHAESQESKNMYIRMSRQELEHADGLKTMAVRSVGDDRTLHTIWHHLQGHLDSWKDGIMEKLKRAETGK